MWSFCTLLCLLSPSEKDFTFDNKCFFQLHLFEFISLYLVFILYILYIGMLQVVFIVLSVTVAVIIATFLNTAGHLISRNDFLFVFLSSTLCPLMKVNLMESVCRRHYSHQN